MRVRYLIHTLAMAALACASLAQAQMVYRIVGADGRITFSDKPPAPGAATKVEPVMPAGTGTAISPNLPYELRQAASRFPVTLYTGNDCGPCGQGRAMLTARGIPFSERTVQTQEDAQALKGLSGEASIPFLTVGAQRIRGFSEAEWTQYLDAAGYPKTSQLPGGYRNPQATSLSGGQKAAAAAPEPAPEPPPPAPPAAPAAPAPSNPAGIQF